MVRKKRKTHIMKSIAYARIVWGHLLSSFPTTLNGLCCVGHPPPIRNAGCSYFDSHNHKTWHEVLGCITKSRGNARV